MDPELNRKRGVAVMAMALARFVQENLEENNKPEICHTTSLAVTHDKRIVFNRAYMLEAQ